MACGHRAPVSNCSHYSFAYLSQVQELGGVPLMTKASDMSYTIPDEKVNKSITYPFPNILDIRPSVYKKCSCFYHSNSTRVLFISGCYYLCGLSLRAFVRSSRGNEGRALHSDGLETTSTKKATGEEKGS